MSGLAKTDNAPFGPLFYIEEAEATRRTDSHCVSKQNVHNILHVVFNPSCFFGRYIDDKEKSLNQQIIENGWTLNNLNDHIEHFKIMDTKRREVIAPVPAGIPQPKERVEQWINLQGRAWPKKFAGVVTWVDDTGGIYIHTAEWSRTLTYIRDRLKEIFASSEGSTDSLKVGACCFVKYEIKF